MCCTIFLIRFWNDNGIMSCSKIKDSANCKMTANNVMVITKTVHYNCLLSSLTDLTLSRFGYWKMLIFYLTSMRKALLESANNSVPSIRRVALGIDK